MPELPEVETTVNGIKGHINGQQITKVVVHNDKTRLVPNPGLFACVGKQVKRVFRKAKYVCIDVGDGVIVLHLGMSGNLKVLDPSHELLKHDHVEIFFANNKVLRYNDMRRFGGVTYLSNDEFKTSSLFSNLGPDALSDEFSALYLQSKLRCRHGPIKGLLMDNSIVVGVGNIYANESLYDAGIHPFNKPSDITTAQYQALVASIKKILKRSIELGGTTLKDFEQPDGKPGYFVQELKVYGREGDYIAEYDDYVLKEVLGGRSTFFLPKKQPLVSLDMKEKMQLTYPELVMETIKSKLDKARKEATTKTKPKAKATKPKASKKASKESSERKLDIKKWL